MAETVAGTAANAGVIPLKREMVNLAVLLALTTDVMQRQARALGISLTVSLDEHVPDSICADRDKVAWAITSLVGSALRHVRTPGGGVCVHAAWDAGGSTVAITVRDDGPGIPHDRLARLLNREGWHPGSALALLLVEDIAVAHGGGIEVESRNQPSEHFTTVRFTLRAR